MRVQTLAGIVSVGTLLLGFGEVVMSQTTLSERSTQVELALRWVALFGSPVDEE